MNTDLEIAHSKQYADISAIAKKIGLTGEDYDCYGSYKAKLKTQLLERCAASDKQGKLILVTAITPTPAGEGKTTVSVGLADAFALKGCRVMAALREPSLGPVFGVKGGAAGGGYAQVVPMEDINLHFTGDFHAISAANNLIAAMIDNHIFHGNSLKIVPEKITWKRCLDMNDRALRHVTSVTVGKGGYSRETGFDITAASEIMAVFCLASSLADLKKRIADIVIGENSDGRLIRVADLHAEGAATALLAEAFRPNLVQTLAETPVLIHGGPFANIAHGCNSLIATRTALKLADYVVTEAGFGADLGAEKFIDIKCRIGGIKPAAAVLVATIRALKMHGGLPKEQLHIENVDALRCGVSNLRRHIENITQVYNIPVVVAMNRFPTDTAEEIDALRSICAELNVPCVLTEVWEKGGAGATGLVDELLELMQQTSDPQFVYPLELSLEEKIRQIAIRVYRAACVEFTDDARKKLAAFEENGYGELPVCIAKTQYSFSDDPKQFGAPQNFTLTVREVRLSAGAGFIVALTGTIMTMPGLPSVPAAENIDVHDITGEISGLF